MNMNLEDLKLSKKAAATLADAGWTVEELATAAAEQLTALGLTPQIAIKAIGAAGRLVNEGKLSEAYRADVLSLIPPPPPEYPPRPLPFSPVSGPATSAAFPAEWLSGQVAPPAMSIRIKRIFDQAARDYQARGM